MDWKVHDASWLGIAPRYSLLADLDAKVNKCFGSDEEKQCSKINISLCVQNNTILYLLDKTFIRPVLLLENEPVCVCMRKCVS